MNTEKKSAIHQQSFDLKPKQEKEHNFRPEMQLKDIKEFAINLPKIEAIIKENKKGRGNIDQVVLKDAVKTYKRMKILFNKVFFLCGNCGQLIVAYPNYKAVILLICLSLLDFVFIFFFFSKIDSLIIFGERINKFFLFILLLLIATLLTILLEVLIMSNRSFRRIFLKSECEHCGKKVIDFERIIL
jgi:hypothetical protein